MFRLAHDDAVQRQRQRQHAALMATCRACDKRLQRLHVQLCAWRTSCGVCATPQKVAPPAPPAPSPAPVSAPAPASAGQDVTGVPPPPLPSRYFRQNGSNCRMVAVGHLLRLERCPVEADLLPSYRTLLQQHLPAQARLVQGLSPAAASAALREGLKWTRACAAFDGILPQFVQQQRAHLLALQLMPAEFALLTAASGITVAALATRSDSWGFLYFSAQHCMACLQDERGAWWDVPQSSAKSVTEAVARTRLTRARGVVLCLTRDAVTQLCQPRLTRIAHAFPLFVLRAALWRMGSTAARLSAWVAEAWATPEPRWGSGMRAALAHVAEDTWRRSGQ